MLLVSTNRAIPTASEREASDKCMASRFFYYGIVQLCNLSPLQKPQELFLKMKENILNISNVDNVIRVMKKEFDTHELIIVFILSNTLSYLSLLRQYGSVETANQQIGRLLIDKASELGITKIGETQSENIFGNINTCALWKRN